MLPAVALNIQVGLPMAAQAAANVLSNLHIGLRIEQTASGFFRQTRTSCRSSAASTASSSDHCPGRNSVSQETTCASAAERVYPRATTATTLGDLYLLELPRNIQFSVDSVVRPSLKQSTSYVSCSTFFENKYGFPETDLLGKAACERPELLPLIGRFPLSGTIVKCLRGTTGLPYQQYRGFKTRRSIDPKVLGGGSTFLGRIQGQPAAVSNDKLKNLVDEFEPSSPMQAKLKTAFAEGYLARSQDGGASNQKTWQRIIWRIMTVLMIAAPLYLLYTVSSAVRGGVRGVGFLNGDRFEVNPEDVTVTFDDVKGADEAKQELQDVVEFLKNPERFTTIGAKLPKGVLLVGPPGIGKTLLARAVAGEAGVPFFHASGSEFDEIFVGTGAKRVRQLFASAKMRAPCIIFIDEIDSVGARRTSSQIHPYANQTINQLLSEMDGFSPSTGVIVLGATNRRDNLDQAILRPGRFDVEVSVFPPDLKGRKDILDLYMSKVKRAANVDIDRMAKGTTGFTGADLENLVNQAALKAAIDGRMEVTMDDMEFARDKVLMGPEKKAKIMSKDELWMTAHHEAGHTLVAHHTKDATPLHKVTIIPRGVTLGHTSMIPDKEEYSTSRAQLLATLDVLMGGRVAEELVYGAERVTTGASNDFERATAIATAMVKKYGMSEKVGVRVFSNDSVDSGLSMLHVNDVSPATTELVDSEIKKILQDSYDRAKALLKLHSAEHKALAKALMERETLDLDEIKAVLGGHGFEK